MGLVVIDLSMSLDGYITGPNDNPENGLGDGGDRLHEWYLSNDYGGSRTDADKVLIENTEKALGALIIGRRTYDNSLKYWGPKSGPHGDTPTIVVSHSVHEEGLGDGSPFTFTDNIQTAYDLAQKAAGEKDVRIMGANVAQQYLKAGLVDEITVHLVPAFTGGGQALFANLGADVKIWQTQVISSQGVTHLTYRPVR